MKIDEYRRLEIEKKLNKIRDDNSDIISMTWEIEWK